MRRVFPALIAALVGLPAAGSADAARAPDESDYSRAERFLPYATAPLVTGVIENPVWMPDGALCYLTRSQSGEQINIVDPKRGTRLFAERCSGPSGIKTGESLSPDKQRTAFIRDYNLWVRDISSGAERQLTTDGVKDFGYATDNPGWEHSGRAILTWSPDSRKIATYQQDERGVGEMYLVGTRLGHPQLESWKYAMAGDEVIATLRRVIIDVDSGSVVSLKIPPDPHRSSPCYDVQCGDGAFADVQWSPDGSHLAFVSTSRDHKRAELREADARSGEVRDILEEQASSYYESDLSSTTHGAVNWRYLPASREIIWFSERDDHAHLYLYDAKTGKLKHRITGGDWNVVEVLKVDEKRRALYFTAVGRDKSRDPYFVHLYKVGIDGRQIELLTPENADHDISMSPSGDYFLDRYSTPEVPPLAVLRNLDGKLLSTLETADISRLSAAGWRPPVSFTVKARDGRTDLYGLLFKPTTFDPKAKYPIVTWVYPGPHTGSVGSRQFAAARGDRQALAELGFIVITLDGMGTPLRSKRFHDVIYGNMIDNTLPDQVAGLKQLGERYPWIDLTRAGIYGHSGGGYAAAAAMLTYPDFFKVGISESGNHDQRGYTDDWGEKFIGLLEHKPDGTSNYDGQDTLSLVKHLKGHLLLMHGTLDDNVPPTLTLLMVDALIKANKDFDLLMLPNQHHLYEGAAETYATRRRWDYFVRYLLGAEPPHEYKLQRPAEDATPIE